MESNLVWNHSICHKYDFRPKLHDTKLNYHLITAILKSQNSISTYSDWPWHQTRLLVIPHTLYNIYSEAVLRSAKRCFLKLKSGVNKGVRVGGHIMKTVHLICGWVTNLSQFSNLWWIKCRNPRKNMAWRSMLRRLRWWKSVRGLALRNSRSFLRVTIEPRIAP